MKTSWRIWLTILVAVLLAMMAASVGVAAAEPNAQPRADASAPMHNYFDGEKRGGLILVALGAVELGAAAVLWTRDSAFAEGSAIPLAAFGLVHAAAGVFVYVASAGRQTKFATEIDRDGNVFVIRESKRMVGVSRQLTILKWVEAALIVGGTAALATGLATDRDRLAGVGLGIAIPSAATLVFDFVAARRAHLYRRRLGEVSVAIVPTARGTTAGLGWSFRF